MGRVSSIIFRRRGDAGIGIRVTRRGVARGSALIAGGLAFAAFWVISASDFGASIPWIVSLGVHGTSIVLAGTALVLTATCVRESLWGRRLALMGAWVALAGLLTIFPLIPIGLGIFASGLIVAAESLCSRV